MSELSPRIERGAALLDERRPGWEREIDLETLDLASECDCILGQVYGDFSYGLSELNGDAFHRPEKYGYEAFATEMYAELTVKWLRYLKRRLRP